MKKTIRINETTFIKLKNIRAEYRFFAMSDVVDLLLEKYDSTFKRTKIEEIDEVEREINEDIMNFNKKPENILIGDKNQST